MKKTLTAWTLIACLCPSANAQTIKTLPQDLANEIGSVDPHDGITQAQAGAAARYYCRRYIAECGSTRPAVDRNADWEITPLTGIAGTPDQNNILVGKRTWKVRWGKGPSLSLLDFLGSKEAAPKPLNAGGSDPASTPKAKIEFVVLPDGSVANARFRQSSSNRKCDELARRHVESWRFPPRERPIDLLTEVGCAQ
ncbi:TonB family protein [Lysobacter sp. K5869]|uniref:energy transducer TonB n=1 Tax=Lysobacter sp. K5869 TaxID=2820808 RepID=UPI001C060795|nr:TonB family protein [Lysobacter sp. K5869]QWP78393.1 TonB family protein [Lysobacter sp. K5869]